MGKTREVSKTRQGVAKLEKSALSSKPSILGIKKEYLKSKNTCRVTFRLPRMAAPTANEVCLVGDFNNWDKKTNIMKKNTNGHFTATLELMRGKNYQYRYFIDNSYWENDWRADKYQPNTFGSENSVVSL